jgi:hypothetical protein
LKKGKPNELRQLQEGQVRQGWQEKVSAVYYRDALGNGRLLDRLTDPSVASIQVLTDPNGVPHAVLVTYSSQPARVVPWSNVKDVA